MGVLPAGMPASGVCSTPGGQKRARYPLGLGLESEPVGSCHMGAGVLEVSLRSKGRDHRPK